jgi:hypothetical protein
MSEPKMVTAAIIISLVGGILIIFFKISNDFSSTGYMTAQSNATFII